MIRRLEPWIAVAILAGLTWSAWPERGAPLYYADSAAYADWPRTVELDGVRVPRSRPDTYPLLLKVAPPGPALVHVQTWLSLACWCYLGWTFARSIGLLIAGLLALAPMVRLWNLAVLTESVTLSLLALLVALSLELRREIVAGSTDRRRTILLVAWLVVAEGFALVRDSHLARTVPAIPSPELAGMDSHWSRCQKGLPHQPFSPESCASRWLGTL